LLHDLTRVVAVDQPPARVHPAEAIEIREEGERLHIRREQILPPLVLRVREPELRGAAVRGVADKASRLGLGVAGVTASPLPGPSGNVEYFLWLRRDAGPLEDEALETALREGPS